MALIAYRSQYRIYLHEQHNHLVYERSEEMTLAKELPHYVSDVERAMLFVKPGFTVLSDLRRTLGPNLPMLAVYQQVGQILLSHGIGLMVEVHLATPSMPKFMQQVRAQSGIPTRMFTDLREAEAFLHEFRRQPTT